MTTCFGKSCLFGLLCVFCVGVCQFVSVFFLFWHGRWDAGFDSGGGGGGFGTLTM